MEELDELSILKKQLKLWEREILKAKGQKPTKDDVETAPEHIKDGYKRYQELQKQKTIDESSELKKQLWEREIQNTKGQKPTKDDIGTTPEHIRDGSKSYQKLQKEQQVDVWGPELNKKKEVKKRDKLPEQQQPIKKKPKSQFMELVGKKLLANANLLASTKPTPNSTEELSPPKNVNFTIVKRPPSLFKASPSMLSRCLSGTLKENRFADVGRQLCSDHEGEGQLTIPQKNQEIIREPIVVRRIPSSQVENTASKNPKTTNINAPHTRRKSQEHCNPTAVPAQNLVESPDFENSLMPSSFNDKISTLKRPSTTDVVRKLKKMRYEDDKVPSDSDNMDVGWADDGVGPPRIDKSVPKTNRKRTSRAAADDGNYVKLNMKIRRYCKKGQRITGSKFKRQQWKKRTNNKCFKCGKSGHWANACTNKGIGNSEEDAEVEGQSDVDVDEDTSLDSVQPLYKINDDGSLPAATTEILDALHQFGFTSFRRGQEEAVMRVLCGLSTLLVLSTGAGKSLCYQLPAMLYHTQCRADNSKRPIALIISPLVALMDDQIATLPAFSLGATLHSGLAQAQRSQVLEAVSKGRYHFLLVSPETLVGGGLMGNLPPISFACIDEVHCVSEWSHNFRPAYLRVCQVLRQQYGVTCILGMTATVNRRTLESICQYLDVHHVIESSAFPENLRISVSRDRNQDEALLDLLRGDRFSQHKSIIVYCTRREETERLASLLRTVMKNDSDNANSWTADCYHAGLAPSQRRTVQNRFMSGRLRVVFATVAFGMGLHKADLGGVIHYNTPKTVESYVQEIGRAGRDGRVADGHVLLREDDLQELKRHIYTDSMDRVTIKKFVRRLFVPCQCTTECKGHERALVVEKTVQDLDLKEEGIDTLLCYLEAHQSHFLLNLPRTYATCVIKSYKGQEVLQRLAVECAPLQYILDHDLGDSSTITVELMDVSQALEQPSGQIKRTLKKLEWTKDQACAWKKTGVMVQFSDLAFHARCRGDLQDLEAIVNYLDEKAQGHEQRKLRQMYQMYQSLQSVSHSSVYLCCQEVDESRCTKLKEAVNKYLQETSSEYEPLPEPSISTALLEEIQSQVVSFLDIYGSEQSFTGRSVARILQGIPSPCFPAEVWGKVRRFWRSLIHLDFNSIKTIANQIICRSR